MSKQTVCAAVLLVLLRGTLPSLCYGEAHQRVHVGTTLVSERSPDGTRIQASVEVAAAGECDVSRYWGGGGRDTETVVVGLRIEVGRDSVWIPFTAVAGLANPLDLGVSVRSGRATVTLEGGDAAVSYMASWVVVRGRLQRRRIESGEFPQDVWEEAVYSCCPQTD